ncbi:hypothetical protein [Mesorhizobium sp. LSJC265A00]|uniref:hypothetical protein n=1 Tax=Mesorhizobium sp. LSJC265A00 TaxID=1287322 RepID=UPI0018DC3710|nr:hypothetical protein [Mesorhizobium sp. LSJC265A00]
MGKRLADLLAKDTPDLAGQRQARIDAKAHAAISGIPLEHDAEKCEAVFGRHHAPSLLI